MNTEHQDGLSFLEHPEFGPKFAAFADAVRHHAANEEREVFAALRERVDQSRLEQMEAPLRTAEAAAPTHAHRSAPEGAIGNFVIGPVVSILDRARDALRTLVRRFRSRRSNIRKDGE